jgi:hypothetical protein
MTLYESDPVCRVAARVVFFLRLLLTRRRRRAVYCHNLGLEDFMRVRFSLCSVAIVVSGCYSNVPIQLSTAQPNTKLVVALTDAGSDSLARYLGPGVATVNGKLLQNGDDGLSLAVTQVTMRSGAEQFWKGETVALPKYSVATVQERKISKPRTLLLGGAILAALFTVKLSGVGSGGAGKGTGPPSNPK